MTTEDGLRAKAHAIIETCKTVLLRKQGELPPVDGTTYFSALQVLRDAQAVCSKDKVLADVKLKDPKEWTAVQTAMEMVIRCVPTGSTESAGGPPPKVGVWS